MNFQVTSSATLSSAAGYPQVGPPQNSIRIKHKVTVVNGEVLTYKHFEDVEKVRDVTVLVAATGLVASGITVAKTDAETTTITFATAGTYMVLIDIN